MTSELLVEIARCPELSLAGTGDHPCREIVSSQGRRPDARQVPEPWSGHLASAPILFLTQNPSLSWTEAFPTSVWSDADIADFFENRFSGGREEWTRGNRGRQRDGSFSGRAIPLWAYVAGRAAEILDRPAVPGVDFVLSQVVHCKMEGSGTDERTSAVLAATTFCSDRYLNRLLEASAASVVVVLGVRAREAVTRATGALSSESNDVDGPRLVAGRRRVFAWLPLPSSGSGGRKNFPDRLVESQMRLLRRHVRSDDSPRPLAP